MKRILVFAAALMSGLLLAADGKENVEFGRIKVYVSLENSPAIATKSTGANFGKTSLTNKRWLVIKTDFTPGVGLPEKEAGGVRNPKSVDGGWADDVTMSVDVLYPATVGRDRKIVYGLFSGSTTFWSIPLDAKQHSTAMMVPPQLLDRYLAMRSASSEMSAGKNDFLVRVSFRDRTGRSIGYAFHNVKGVGKDDPVRYFDSLCGKVPPAYVISGGVFSKDRTPWGVLNFSDYDLEKPVSEPAADKK